MHHHIKRKPIQINKTNHIVKLSSKIYQSTNKRRYKNKKMKNTFHKDNLYSSHNS
ncbi:hypothetical protein HanRHA438_Chr14g0640971 [Helianthus annuus]|nr:hypothetical protein HanRHA438_Chr14g0640971 [Helianthus annuus]